MTKLESNADLLSYLVSLADRLENAACLSLAADLRFAADQAAGLSTEFLGESLIALRKVSDVKKNTLDTDEREDLVRIIRQIEFAINR